MRALQLVVFSSLLVSLSASPARAQAQITVNENVNFKFGALGQFQGDWLEDPAADDTQQNLFIRRIRLLFGGQVAKNLGIDRDWVARVIGQVGNFGEIYARNLGDQSPLKVKRGFNALWNDGGLLYAPPPR